MRTRIVAVVFSIALLLWPPVASSTSLVPVPLEELFDSSEIVAIGRIVSGTMEGYSSVVYRAEVTTAIKGVEEGLRIHLGPYRGYEIGGEYLFFLQSTGQTVGDLVDSSQVVEAGDKFDQEDSFHRVAFAGFGSMNVQYTCAFEGCGECVDVAIRHVPIPDSLESMPYDDPQDRASDFAWVRRVDLVQYLRTLLVKVK